MPLFLVGTKARKRRGEPWRQFAVIEAHSCDAAVAKGEVFAALRAYPGDKRLYVEAEPLEIGSWYPTSRIRGEPRHVVGMEPEDINDVVEYLKERSQYGKASIVEKLAQR